MSSNKSVSTEIKVPEAKISLARRLFFAVVGIATLPFYPVRNRVSKDGNKVWVTGHDSLIYTWAVVLGGAAVIFLAGKGIISDGLSGWLSLLAFFGYVLVYAKDINRTGAVVIGLVLALFFTSAELVNVKYDLPVLGPILDFFRSLGPVVNVGWWKATASVVAIIIAVYCLPWATLNGRHVLTSRTIERIRVGQDALQTPASGLSIAVEWKDLLEFVLGFGAGSIVFRDRNGRMVKQIPNILGLYFIWSFIEPLYQSTATREDDLDIDPAALEEMS